MEKFDAIIVGAGLAGLASAYTLARAGVEVLALERGDYPGAKNMTGGRIYVNPVRNLFPDLWKNAPLERFIVREEVTMMARERSVTVSYYGEELREKPRQSYSILRSKFDRWLAKQAEAQGAVVLSKVKVDDLVIENGKIEGVIAGGDELRSGVVIACDGALSLTAEKAGIREPGAARDYAVGIKEVIELDTEHINARFNLEGNEGAARLYVGEVTRGKFGGGFLYTNEGSISLGIVVGIKDLMDDDPKIEAPALMDEFKRRPEVASLIKGGETAEYSARVISEGGFKSLSALYGNGILVAGDAAGLVLNIGFTVRGMEYALASGYYAAQAALRAREAGNFSAGTLATYKSLLEQSFVLKDFKNFQETPNVLGNPRFFRHYPELAGNIMKDIYAVPAGSKNRLYPTVKQYMTVREMWAMFKDMWKLTKT
mgnify:CR=1 FL=1